MQLINTTDYPDQFLRRLVSWCCKQLKIPVKSIPEAKFRNQSGRTTGRCWSYRGRIVISVIKPGNYRIEEVSKFTGTGRAAFYAKFSDPVHIVSDHGGGEVGERAAMLEKVLKLNIDDEPNRLRALVSVTAHEVAHRANYLAGSTTRDKSAMSPRHRRVGGGSEKQTRVYERKLLELFMANKDRFVQQWSVEPKRREVVKLSRSARNERKAHDKLAEWTKKLSTAQRKVTKYKSAVRRYERAAAARAAITATPAGISHLYEGANNET